MTAEQSTFPILGAAAAALAAIAGLWGVWCILLYFEDQERRAEAFCRELERNPPRPRKGTPMPADQTTVRLTPEERAFLLSFPGGDGVILIDTDEKMRLVRALQARGPDVVWLSGSRYRGHAVLGSAGERFRAACQESANAR